MALDEPKDSDNVFVVYGFKFILEKVEASVVAGGKHREENSNALSGGG